MSLLSLSRRNLYNYPMDSLWIPLALASAVLLATSDALTKRALQRIRNEYLVAWLRLLFSLPILTALLFFVPVPPLDYQFYRATFIALPLEIISIILFTKALKVSPLSLTLPFLSLTPVFLLVTPSLLLGERISVLGAAGIVLIASGGYTLNIGSFREGFFEPFLAIRREKGSVFMILVAFIYSFTSTLGKEAIEHSSPVFFGIVYYIVLFIAFTPIALSKCWGDLKTAGRSGALGMTVLPGMLDSLMNVTHMKAVSLTKVAYMISVKRLSLLIGVFYGYLFFREPGIRERLLGTALMLAGFVLIVLYH